MQSGQHDVMYLLSMFEAFKLAVDVPRPKKVIIEHHTTPLHIEPQEPSNGVLSVTARPQHAPAAATGNGHAPSTAGTTLESFGAPSKPLPQRPSSPRSP
jgi:hypothetical protein